LKIYILQKLFAVTSLQFSRTQIFEAQGYYVRKRAQELSEATRTKENNNLLNTKIFLLIFFLRGLKDYIGIEESFMVHSHGRNTMGVVSLSFFSFPSLFLRQLNLWGKPFLLFWSVWYLSWSAFLLPQVSVLTLERQ